VQSTDEQSIQEDMDINESKFLDYSEPVEQVHARGWVRHYVTSI